MKNGMRHSKDACAIKRERNSDAKIGKRVGKSKACKANNQLNRRVK